MKKYRKKVLNDKMKNVLQKCFSVISVIAAVVTLYSLIIAQQQTKKLESLTREISTRSLGFSPNQFNEIIQLINQSQEGDNITIFNDVLGYGIYSSPDKFEEYLISIINALDRNVNIDIFIYNHLLFKEIGMKQININSDSLKVKTLKDIKMEEKLFNRAFNRKINNNNKIINDISNFRNETFFTSDVNMTIEEYYKKLDSLFSYMRSKLNDFKNCQIIACNKEFPIFFWKLNMDKAIYSFPRKEGIDEIAFFSREINFLNYLSVIKQEMINEF